MIMRCLFTLLALVGLCACGDDDQPAVVATARSETAPLTAWSVLDTPDGFGEIATRCLATSIAGGVRVFVTKDDVRAASAVAVVLDPGCRD